MSDKDFLTFIYYRMHEVHGEKTNADYMLRFRKIIDSVDKAKFKFDMKATPCDPTGYYHPKWDKSQRLTVIAENREQAKEKATAVLGENDRRWPWAFIFTSIDEIGEAGNGN